MGRGIHGPFGPATGPQGSPEWDQVLQELERAEREVEALRQERDHWKSTADAYANQNMAAEDLSGISGNADDIVRNLLEERDDYRLARKQAAAEVEALRSVVGQQQCALKELWRALDGLVSSCSGDGLPLTTAQRQEDFNTAVDVAAKYQSQALAGPGGIVQPPQAGEVK